MKLLFIISLTFLLVNCSKPKTVLLCGDHKCVNKTEAEQFFEENLTLEVQIIDKKDKKTVDLVELNLKKNQQGEKKVNIFSKDKTEKKIKDLSNKEISKIKKSVKKKEIIAKKIIKKEKKLLNKGKPKQKKNKYRNKKDIRNNVNKTKKKVADICTILEKCSIDEISKYLLDEGRNKKFPDITTRQ